MIHEDNLWDKCLLKDRYTRLHRLLTLKRLESNLILNGSKGSIEFSHHFFASLTLSINLCSLVFINFLSFICLFESGLNSLFITCAMNYEVRETIPFTSILKETSKVFVDLAITCAENLSETTSFCVNLIVIIFPVLIVEFVSFYLSFKWLFLSALGFLNCLNTIL